MQAHTALRTAEGTAQELAQQLSATRTQLHDSAQRLSSLHSVESNLSTQTSKLQETSRHASNADAELANARLQLASMTAQLSEEEGKTATLQAELQSARQSQQVRAHHCPMDTSILCLLSHLSYAFAHGQYHVFVNKHTLSAVLACADRSEPEARGRAGGSAAAGCAGRRSSAAT